MSTKRLDFFFPLYVRDFLTSTIGWTAAERGHYLTLLMVQWDRGEDGLPADMAGLERISQGVSDCWDLLGEKFPVWEDGKRRNRRLEEHRGKAEQVHEKRSTAAKKGNDTRWGDGDRDRKPIAGRSQTDRTPIANGSPGDHGAIAPRSHPQPQPQPHTHTPFGRVCVSGEHAHEAGGGTEDIQGIWETFRQAWNKTPNTKPWHGLGCPTDAFEVVTDLSFARDYPAALERLGASKFFTDPAALTWFLRNWHRVLAGEFDGRTERAGKPKRKIFSLDEEVAT
jgi:uncharacterized protein YdaU (DUF1376 family)